MMFEYIQGGELFSRIRMEARFQEETAKFYLS